MQLRRLAAGALFASLAAALPASALAQETRAELLANKREEKAKQLKPYEPGKLERAILYYERSNPIAKLAPRNGFFIKYGYTWKPAGSGIAIAGGWRHDVFDRNARVELEGGYSLLGYRMVRADFFLPRLMNEKLELGVEGSHHYFPQEDFYGLGGGTPKSDRTSYLYEGLQVQGRAVLTPVRWFSTGARVGHTDVKIGSGKDDRYPSTEELFTPPQAPGLLDDPAFLVTDLFAAVDTRDQPGNARAGGYYGLVWRRFSDRDLDQYSFDSMEVDLRHFVPIFDAKRVLAARVRLITTTADDQHDVPFYFRPTLGGGNSLRSVADYRFRDRNVLFMNVEYRWEAFSGLDMALFTDFGSVASRFSDLGLGAEQAYGIGLRFNTYKSVFWRVDLAGGGNEGIQLIMKFSNSF